MLFLLNNILNGVEYIVNKNVGKNYFQIHQSEPIPLLKNIHIPIKSIITTSSKSEFILQIGTKSFLSISPSSQIKILSKGLEIYNGKISFNNEEKRTTSFYIIGKYKITSKAKKFFINYKDDIIEFLMIDGTASISHLDHNYKLNSSMFFNSKNNELNIVDEDSLSAYKNKSFLEEDSLKTDAPTININSWEEILRKENLITRKKYHKQSINFEKRIKKNRAKKIKEKKSIPKCILKKSCTDFSMDNYKGKIVEECIKWVTIKANEPCK